MTIMAKEAWERLFEIRKKIDLAETDSSSALKNIFNRMHFADIEDEEQNTLNQGIIYYREYEEQATFQRVELSYIINPNELGLVYAKIDKQKSGNLSIKYEQMSGYVRFLGDLIADKVIYHQGLKCFLRASGRQYERVTNENFYKVYRVDPKWVIPDFYEAISFLFKEGHIHFPADTVVHTKAIAGKDWVYDCEQMELTQREIKDNERFSLFLDVCYADIDMVLPQEFLAKVTNDSFSLHNVRLLHAYTLFRRMGLVTAEKFFILKDAGRTGKGLTIDTFKGIFKYRLINFDALTCKGFEAQNEWVNFIDVELAHANETGAIGEKEMRVLRKIATGERVTGRAISQNAINFKLDPVLVLDTNEKVDIGDLKANRTRAVKIAFKDRPEDETDEERHAFFSKYWQFIKPDGDTNIKASVSFLLASLEYLKEQGNKFTFHDTVLKNYFSSEELTETQEMVLLTIDRQGFILAGDEDLQRIATEDYGSMRTAKAKADMRAIGVKLNKPKRIDNEVMKVHIVGDSGLFNSALGLLDVKKEEM